MDITILCFEGFTDIDVFLMWDLFNRVSHPGWRVRLLGDGTHHTSVSGLTIPMHGHVREANEAAAVLVTSGPGAPAELAGAEQRAIVLRSVQPVGRGLSFARDQKLPTRIYATGSET